MRFNSMVRNITVVAFNKSIAVEITARLGNPRLLPPRSPEQQAICLAVAERNDHVVVEALAGTGKTTTIEHICSMFPQARAEAKTLHSLGFGALRYHLKKYGTDPQINQDKVQTIVKALLDARAATADDRERMESAVIPVVRLVSLCKSQGFLAFRGEATDSDLQALVDRYDVEMPAPEDRIPDEDVFDLVRQALVANNRNYAQIDFDDMVYLPLALRVGIYPMDLILIDESQDLNPVQIELVRKAANGKGQCVFVGDRNQAIYGFRGADVEAMDTIEKSFGARVLPLSVCRRCPVKVIEAAQCIVPAIRHKDDAIEGEVGSLDTWEDMIAAANPDDLILCRTTAPLVDACLRAIRQGKAATVKGRDIGKGLQNLLGKIRKNRRSKGLSILEALDAYKDRQLESMKEERKQGFLDRMETLVILAEGCSQWEDVGRKIESIFAKNDDDSTSGMLVFSTAHKAKGLEADNVYVIKPELMPGPWARQEWQAVQEMNLKYVAITRARKRLVWVDSKPAAKGNEKADISRPRRKARQKALATA